MSDLALGAGYERPRLPIVVAAALAVMTALSVVPNVGLLLAPVRPGAPPTDASPIQVLFDAPFLIVAPLMGLLVVRRQPRNAVGWLFIVFPGVLSVGFLGDGAARHFPPSTGLAAIVTVASAVSNISFLTLILLLGLFPTGRLYSRRWRVMPVLAAIAVLALTVSALLTPRPVDGLADLVNPIGRPDLGTVREVAGSLASMGIMAALVLAVAHLIARFRAAGDVERQQLKWFGFATGIIGALLVVAATTEILREPSGSGPIGTIGDIAWSAAFSCFALIPIAAGFAILRYRLYDIDRIISRTISYAIVTAFLAATYVVAFLGLQALLAPFTAGENPIAVAASTLVVFALFAPVRRRIGDIIERRFNRSRYDAEREIEAFAAHVRDEVEVERVAHELGTTLRRTMQPASAAIWLRRDPA